MLARPVLLTLLLSLAGVIAGLFSAEIGLRLAVSAFPSWSHPVARSWRLNDERQSIPTAIGLDDWAYGARYAPGLRRYPEVFEEGVFHVSTSNRFSDAGFRDDRDSGDAPLLALGDSFTGCFGVESEECWVTLLARDLGVEFANLGMWAGGAVEQVRRLDRWGRAYHPRLIVWGFYGNDLVENWHFVHYGPAWGGGRQGLKLWLHNSSILWRVVLHMRVRATPRQLDERVWYRGDGLAVRFDNRCQETALSRAEVREGLALQKEAMVEAKKFAEEQGATLVLALFPTKEVTYWKQLQDVGPPWVAGCDLVAQYRVISDLAHGLDIPVIDLVPAFTASAARKEQVYFPQNDHWNPAGNRLAFSVIKNALAERGLAKRLSNQGRHDGLQHARLDEVAANDR